MRIKL